MHTKSLKLMASALITVGVLQGCATSDVGFQGQQGQQTAIGAGVGAVVGAGLGQAIGRNTDGTLIGAAIGAAIGGGVGNQWGAITGQLKKDTQGTGTTVTQQADGTLKMEVPSAVSFDTNSANIKPSFVGPLNNVAQTLLKNPQVNVQVVGYTDNVGSAAYNQNLSEKRAQGVVTALEGSGIAAARLSSKGMGMANPVADNATETGRAQNRRVEFILSQAAK